MDGLDEVLRNSKCQKDLGYPPLVTPMSQMVGVQAVLNVLLGRYKNVGKVKAYFREYGKAPGEVNKELMAQVLGDENLYRKIC